MYQKFWCDHKPSVTINYTDDNFLSVGQWVHSNWEWLSGVSFLPHEGHIYDQAPFESIDEEVYLSMLEAIPRSVDWSGLSKFETEDTSEGTHTLACTGGACEVIDILETQ